MDQVIQLQQQIQHLQQEVNSISQVCNQLQQSEQANALQLQQMTQKEVLASQGLRRIQQAAGQLSQEINQISGLTNQMVTQISPFQRNLQGTYTGLTGQVGTSFNQPTTGMLGGGQFGTFGQGLSTQYGLNQGLSNISAIPGWNIGTYSQFTPYSQGYTPSQFGTGSQGYTPSQFGSQWGSSQAFSGTGMNQMGTGIQSGNWSQSGIPGQQGSNSQLLGMMAPLVQNTLSGISGAQGSNLGTSWGQSNLGQSGFGQSTGLSGYSPYQSNQFGFR